VSASRRSSSAASTVPPSCRPTPRSALRARTAPLDVRSWPLTRTLPRDERAALEALGAAVLVPVRRGLELAAVICLGAKRSGDVYTPTDLTLLGAVADKVSGELLRFDAAVILRQEREMSDALRSYVPGPVASRLTRGQSIEGGEHDVSVLFVDIRGYTTYSEQQAAGTVFSMVNRYTEAVSGVIQRRGGTVVEFLGDGLMAVFGAPDSLPDHARVSVQAACEVVATVRHLALGAADGEAPIAVGVDCERPGIRRQRSDQRPVRLHRGRRCREPRLAHPGTDARVADSRHRCAYPAGGGRMGCALQAPRARAHPRPQQTGRHLRTARRRRVATRCAVVI
jgi:class 3 adenylate cyclase